MGRLSALVLGSAAGGGVPQWNCACTVCRLAWAGDPRVKARSQAGLAVIRGSLNNRRLCATDEGEHESPFVLINASPDLRQQILATPALQPRGLRTSPIAAVVLTGAEVDQIAGLLTLRERTCFALFATEATMSMLAANPIFNVLADETVTRHAIRADVPFALPGGLEGELFLVPGKAPLYAEGEAPDLAVQSETNVGIELRADNARLVFIPGAASLTPEIVSRLRHADAVLFDGTLFTDDEMIAAGTGYKSGRRMGHMPVDGPGGTLSALAGLGRRRILVHINNTNPILIEDSPERRAVAEAGFEVAEDGMRIEL